jgi:hypothetical protein
VTNHQMHDMQGGSMEHGRPCRFEASESTGQGDPTFGGHNQMVVGEQTMYLSHLPMFMFDPQSHEHNFQVILEVALSTPEDAQATYADDRRSHPDVRMYTMCPAPFAMVELDPQDPTRTTLMGDIFRGHLERGGEPIIRRATADVTNTVYFHEFEPDAEPLDQLEYVLFGKEPDVFLAHVITRPPDFDQILGATVGNGTLAAADLEQGIRIKIPGRANTIQTRIKAGESVVAQAVRPGSAEGQPLEIQLDAGTEFYFEEGELRLPMTMHTTPEEEAAGF